MLLNIIVYLACVSLLLLRCVLLGLTVYYDARAKHLVDATKWAVISAIFGVAGCLLYLLLGRKKGRSMQRCAVCGALAPEGETVCGRCSALENFHKEVSEPSFYLRRSRTMLVSWLIATAIAALIALFFLVAVSSAKYGYVEEGIVEYDENPPYEFYIEEPDATLVEDTTSIH